MLSQPVWVRVPPRLEHARSLPDAYDMPRAVRQGVIRRGFALPAVVSGKIGPRGATLRREGSFVGLGSADQRRESGATLDHLDDGRDGAADH